MKATVMIFAAALLAGVALGQGRGQQAAPAPAANLNLPAGDAKRGETNYAKYGCWECNGTTGQTGNGARLAKTALTANGFVNFNRNTSTNQMPIYSTPIIS